MKGSERVESKYLLDTLKFRKKNVLFKGSIEEISKRKKVIMNKHQQNLVRNIILIVTFFEFQVKKYSPLVTINIKWNTKKQKKAYYEANKGKPFEKNNERRKSAKFFNVSGSTNFDASFFVYGVKQRCQNSFILFVVYSNGNTIEGVIETSAQQSVKKKKLPKVVRQSIERLE